MPRAGDFGLLVGVDPVGRLIRVGEWLNGDGFSRYSHAFVLLDDDTLLEAEPGGARVRPVSEYPTDLVAWSSWNLTDAQRAATVAAARRYEDVPYSAADYLALAAHRLHVPAPGLRRFIATSDHMICSQLVDQVYLDAQLRMFDDGRWPGYVTPAALNQVLTGPLVVPKRVRQSPC
jgi:hypothetical protein